MAEPVSTPSGRVIATAILYAGALLIGFALVSVPASSVHLQTAHGLSDRQYGQVFIPQLLLAIGGALLAGPVVKRVSLKSMYLVALVAFGSSQTALALSAWAGPAFVLPIIMAATALFGFGFGFGGGPLNGLVAELHPHRSAAAITGLHLMAGVGLMLGPLYFRAFESQGHWAWAPTALVAVAAALWVSAQRVLQGRSPGARESGHSSPAASGFFWLMIVIAFLYALVEGAFSNWAVIFVTIEKSATRDAGALALAAFWAGLTLGRLATTVTVDRLGVRRLWLSLPVLMIAAFLILPTLDSEAALIAGFGFAGLACSSFFPLMVSVAAGPYPGHISWIASMLTASLMCGVGMGSYVIGAAADAIPIGRMYLFFALVPALTLGLMVLCGRCRPGRPDASNRHVA